MTLRAVFLYPALLWILAGCGGDGMNWHAKNISGLMPELAFELVDETGQRASAEDYRGKVVMMFFGFTHCPHYCPTTLAKTGRVLDKLPDGMRDHVRVLFVSVDPKRDNPDNIATYTDNFAPEIIGLTGSEKNLRDLAKRYRTTFSYGKPNEQGNYDVSHGLAIYVFDPAGKARLMILEELPEEQITADLEKLIAATG